MAMSIKQAKEHMDLRVPVEAQKGNVTYRGKLVGWSGSNPSATFSLKVEGTERIVSGLAPHQLNPVRRN